MSQQKGMTNSLAAILASGVPRNIFFGGGRVTPGIFSGCSNSIENKGQTQRGSGGGSPQDRGSSQFVNE
jgi:hypothetical protein